MLRRLASLVGILVVWTGLAFAFPVLFWAVSAVILTLSLVALVRTGAFAGGGRFFTLVGGFTALVATTGFVVGPGEPPTVVATLFAALEDNPMDSEEVAAVAEAPPEDVAGPDKGEPTQPEAAEDPPEHARAPVDIAAAITAATAVVKKKPACKSLSAIGEAWAKLSQVSSDDRKTSRRVNKAARGLEACRRRAVAAAKKSTMKSRAKARVALAQSVVAELTAAGYPKTKTKLAGRGKTTLMVKSPKATREQIDEAFEGSILGRLEAAGFARVTVSGRRVSRAFDLEPAADEAALGEQLDELGLSEPLQL